MKYAIVVHGRFFAFDLVRALLARNKDVVLLTNYPKWAVRRFGIRTGSVKSFWLHGIASRLFERLRRIGLPMPEATLHRSFGHWAASQLEGSDADIVFSFSGVSEESFSKLKGTGKQLLLARCSTHIERQRHILLEERRRSGIRSEVPTDWMTNRENREYKLADAVIVLSSFARKSFVDYNFPESKLKLLLLGAELSHFRPPLAVIRERQKRISNGAPLRVLYVGTVSSRKGGIDLLEVARKTSGLKRFEFCVVGPVEPRMRAVAHDLGQFAKLVPKQPQNALRDYYWWADLFIFPTLEDGFPVVLAQAQAGGLPILTTPNCSGPDMIEDGKTGWICSPKDPEAMFQRLLWCDLHRKDLGEMVNHLYSNYKTRDWSAVADDFSALVGDATVKTPINRQKRLYLAPHHSKRISGVQLQLMLVAFWVALGLYLFLQRPQEVTDPQAFLALASFTLGLLPMLLFFRGYGSGPLPLMPAIGVFYCFAFAIPLFIDFTGLETATAAYPAPGTSALWVLLLGLSALLVSYYWSRSIIRPSAALSCGIQTSSQKVNIILWFFVLAQLSDEYLHWARLVLSLQALLEAAASVGFGYLMLQMFTGKLSTGQKSFLLFVALPLELMAALISGAIAQLLQFFLLIAFVYWLSARKIPWIAIILVAIPLVALHDAKVKYRRQTWFDGDLVNASAFRKLQVFTGLALEPEAAKQETSLLANSTTARLSQLDFLNRVVDQTPDQVPYWGGETYKPLISKFIPRVLWPGKPEEKLGLELSRRYGMRGNGDEITSFNVPWIVEMYANFGGLGVFFGMVIVGVLFAWMDRVFNRQDMLPLDRIIGVVMMGDLILQETNFSLMIGNKILIYISLRLIFQSILGSKRHHQREGGPADSDAGLILS